MYGTFQSPQQAYGLVAQDIRSRASLVSPKCPLLSLVFPPQRRPLLERVVSGRIGSLRGAIHLVLVLVL